MLHWALERQKPSGCIYKAGRGQGLNDLNVYTVAVTHLLLSAWPPLIQRADSDLGPDTPVLTSVRDGFLLSPFSGRLAIF